jgi:hypothetical protein
VDDVESLRSEQAQKFHDFGGIEDAFHVQAGERNPGSGEQTGAGALPEQRHDMNRVTHLNKSLAQMNQMKFRPASIQGGNHIQDVELAFSQVRIPLQSFE